MVNTFPIYMLTLLPELLTFTKHPVNIPVHLDARTLSRKTF